jgi:hypothetical protein
MRTGRLIAGAALLVALAWVANAQTLVSLEPTAEEVAMQVIASTPLRLRDSLLFLLAGQLEQRYLACQAPDPEQVDTMRAAALQLAEDARQAGDSQTASDAKNMYGALSHPVVPVGCRPRS